MNRPLFGPIWSPVNPSGITWPGCSHQAPASCSRCDGTQDDERDEWARLRALERHWDQVIAQRNRATRDEQNGGAG